MKIKSKERRKTCIARRRGTVSCFSKNPAVRYLSLSHVYQKRTRSEQVHATVCAGQSQIMKTRFQRSIFAPSHGSTAVLNTKEKQGGSPHERDPPDRLALCENGGQLLRHCLVINKAPSACLVLALVLTCSRFGVSSFFPGVYREFSQLPQPLAHNDWCGVGCCDYT